MHHRALISMDPSVGLHTSQLIDANSVLYSSVGSAASFPRNPTVLLSLFHACTSLFDFMLILLNLGPTSTFCSFHLMSLLRQSYYVTVLDYCISPDIYCTIFRGKTHATLCFFGFVENKLEFSF